MESDSKNYDQIIISDNIKKLKDDFIALVNDSLALHKLKERIEKNNFNGIRKIYFKNNVIQKEITHYLPEYLFKSSDHSVIKESFLKYYGVAGLAIGKKIWFRLAPKDKDTSVNLKLIYSLEGKLIGIMMIKYFNKNKKIDIFAIEKIFL